VIWDLIDDSIDDALCRSRSLVVLNDRPTSLRARLDNLQGGETLDTHLAA
jgi:hypothetical protein